ncbi:MAG TPA: hypothetical protein VJW75_08815, partial [Candidatus Eisenbacteria bacterium]|nr:hypothetical protein [Candidatus Eisenbacteria bacterium]
MNAKSIPDGFGGVILAWEDYRNGDADIYAQRLSNSGQPLWGPDGVAVATFPLGQEAPTIASDGAGGVIIAWQDLRHGQYDIYAQALTMNGGLRWPSDGVEVCRALGHEISPVITTDAVGGAIIAWRDQRSGDSDVFAQRVAFGGQTLWLANGVEVCTIAGLQADIQIESDPRDGAFIVWRDRRSGTTSDIYAQSIDNEGAVRWAADGVPVCAAANDQLEPSIAPDGHFGLIVAWYDLR